MQRALTPGSDFDPVPTPKPGDWLAEHPESGQTFREFIASGPNRPDGERNRIYLQPLGAFPEDRPPSPAVLKAYGIACFDMPVDLLPIDADLTRRTNPLTGNGQILTGDILAYLKRRLPKGGFCILAITMADLYPPTKLQGAGPRNGPHVRTGPLRLFPLHDERVQSFGGKRRPAPPRLSGLPPKTPVQHRFRRCRAVPPAPAVLQKSPKSIASTLSRKSKSLPMALI